MKRYLIREVLLSTALVFCAVRIGCAQQVSVSATPREMALVSALESSVGSAGNEPASRETAQVVRSTIPSVAADEALSRLKAGNERFANDKETAGKAVAARRAQTAKEQHPFAIVIACADSRTSPEIVFDQTIGELFVVRTAGNLVDEYALGSIEYGVEHLGTRLVVVLGHQRCGAVTAALGGDSAPGHINSLVRDIQPAVAASVGKGGDALTNAIHENDTEVAQKIRSQAELGDHAAEVRIVEAYYNLDTGKVEWLEK
jgi:carbonic anhydrase